MLIEFRAENHRSVRDEQALTMEAGRIGTLGDRRVRKIEGHAEPLICVAALYGANASGKSNVLSALGFLRDAVVDSHVAWPAEGGVPRNSFAWGSQAREPSTFEATILIGGVRHQYGFTVDQARVLEEWLFVWPKGRRQSWLEREGDTFSFGEHLRGENRIVQQVTRPNALFLSTAAQHQHEQLLPVYRWFRHLRSIRVEGYRERYADVMPAAVAAALFAAAAASAAATGSEMVRIHELMPAVRESDIGLGSPSINENITKQLRHLMKAADIGISDFRMDDFPNGGKGKKLPKIMMRHDLRDGEAWLPLEQESAGTQALFRIGPAVIDALTHGRLLVVDELEASLHPLLAAELIKQFNHPETNPHHAQLVFTTHDATLLGTTLGDPALRRDQIWLTEKDPEGATSLYPLTDYKPRKAENVERGYLQGRYGAIPFLGELSRIAE